MQHASQIEHMLSMYPTDFKPRGVEPLGSAGGYSGAAFWRLTTRAGTLCLRRWPPEHPSVERLAFIHAVLKHVERQGFRQLPTPLAAKSGDTYVSFGGQLWELAPWLPGTADFHLNPSRARLTAALETLAHFHVAASSFPRPGPLVGPSPGLTERLTQMRELQTQGSGRIVTRLSAVDWPELEPLARRTLSLFASRSPGVLQVLEPSVGYCVPLQPCIRDVWHDHVLFQGEKVSGLVDFGAMRIESVAGDLARLLGSLVHVRPAALGEWDTGLAAYQTVRRLSSDELELVWVFDRSAALLAGMNWLTWIYVEGRIFADRARVEDRLKEIVARLA